MVTPVSSTLFELSNSNKPNSMNAARDKVSLSSGNSDSVDGGQNASNSNLSLSSPSISPSSHWLSPFLSSNLLTSSKVLNDTRTGGDENLNVRTTNIESSWNGKSNGDSVSSSETSTNICFCLHRIKVKLNSIVELVLVDEAEGKQACDIFEMPNIQAICVSNGWNTSRYWLDIEYFVHWIANLSNVCVVRQCQVCLDARCCF